MIPLFKVHHPEGVGAAIENCFSSEIITEGMLADSFEKAVGDLVGNPYTALVNSCTSALVLAYRMCGVEPGTIVVSTPMTCMATNEPIVNAGAEIVWADIDPMTGNIDPQSVRQILEERATLYGRKVVAVVGVHWAGQPFDVDALTDVARPFGIPVIADAAHALGATYKGRAVGTLCDYTVLSFQAIKHLTTGDGGAICSRAKLPYERLKLLRWFGIDRKYPGPKWEQDIVECGYKFHMNNITAAIGLQQMKDIDWIIRAHKRNGQILDERINNPMITKLRRDPNSESAQWIYTLRVDEPDRFKAYMESKGVAVDRVHIRNDNYTVFNRFRKPAGSLPGCDQFCSTMMNVPVGWWLKEDQLERIIDAINRYS